MCVLRNSFTQRKKKYRIDWNACGLFKVIGIKTTPSSPSRWCSRIISYCHELQNEILPSKNIFLSMGYTSTKFPMKECAVSTGSSSSQLDPNLHVTKTTQELLQVRCAWWQPGRGLCTTSPVQTLRFHQVQNNLLNWNFQQENVG